MSSQNEVEKSLLPHHVQQSLCTTRLAYRQGRRLTAVKVYTINDESVHLLIFGVPSLNLRRETKSLFCKFGKLLQFNIMTKYTCEAFTETYHALYDKLQSARIAKKMLDGKNFYGGLLHVCYAPEMETLEELRSKLMQRRREVHYRLKKDAFDKETQKIVEADVEKNIDINNVMYNDKNTENNIGVKENNDIMNEIKDTKTDAVKKDPIVKMNMGAVNIISFGKKRKKKVKEKVTKEKKINDKIEVVDCTNVEKETVTNIYEALNEKIEIRSMPQKNLNKIVFFNKK